MRKFKNFIKEFKESIKENLKENLSHLFAGLPVLILVVFASYFFKQFATILRIPQFVFVFIALAILFTSYVLLQKVFAKLLKVKKT